MKHTTALALCRTCLIAAAGGLSLNAGAEIFFGGDTKGLPGENVELTISARAGTFLESINIVPAYAAVADALDLVGLTGTPQLLDDSDLSICDDNRTCTAVFLDGKTFVSDAVLVSLRFKIAADAPVGPVPLDINMAVGEDVVPIPAAQNFAVLAVPEPQHWALLLAGIGAIVAANRGRRVG